MLLKVVSRELLIHLIDYLVTNYRNDTAVTCLLDNSRIHILVSMNPDGFENATSGTSIGEGEGNCEGVYGR